MKAVNFYRRLGKGPVLDGSAMLIDGKIVFKGMSKRFIDEVHEKGIKAHEKHLTVDDGMEFLENLKVAFNGIYFRASDVITIDEEK